MKILAIDLGKFKSAACVYESATGQHAFTIARTEPVIYHLKTGHGLLNQNRPVVASAKKKSPNGPGGVKNADSGVRKGGKKRCQDDLFDG